MWQPRSRECLAIAFSLLILSGCTGNGRNDRAPDANVKQGAEAGKAPADNQTANSSDKQPSPAVDTPPSVATAGSPGASKQVESAGQLIPPSVPASTALNTAAVAPVAPMISSPAGPRTTPAPPVVAPIISAPSGAPAPQTVAPGAGSAPVNLSLDQLPADLAICNVAGNMIKVSDYQRMLKLQQLQMNATLAGDPSAKGKMLQMAEANKITLSEEEKDKVYKAAKSQRGTESQFQEYLKSAGFSEEDFRQEVFNTALAFKTSNLILQQSLLPELVNRELLAQAAMEAGGEKKAMDMYFRFKASKNYPVLKQQTGLGAEDIREEIVKAELAKQQLGRLEKKVTVTETDIKKAYEANKQAFKHPEQVRLAKILLLCPPEDVGPMRSVKVQIANATKLTGEQLDAEVARFTQQKRQAAMLLLGQAVGGEDFAKLANQHSEDPDVRANQSGGDLGWLNVADLVPDLQKAISPLKKGQVLPQIVSNPQGFIIFKVTDRRPEGYLALAEARPILEQKLKAEKLNQVVLEWLNKRKNIVRVEFTPKFLAIASGRVSPR